MILGSSVRRKVSSIITKFPFGGRHRKGEDCPMPKKVEGKANLSPQPYSIHDSFNG
jgi:hypothetical protein